MLEYFCPKHGFYGTMKTLRYHDCPCPFGEYGGDHVDNTDPGYRLRDRVLKLRMKQEKLKSANQKKKKERVE